MPLEYNIISSCSETSARRGLLRTARAEIPTPAFMPVGTQGTVKGLTVEEVDQLGSEIILGNCYHLFLRPGIEIISRHGGLHEFMNWPKAILTDSGGFQVFSLRRLLQIDDGGVKFKSHLDGKTHYLTPERVMRLQNWLGSDLAMVLDHCPPYPAEYEEVEEAVKRTSLWAERAIMADLNREQALLAIIQGGIFGDLRRKSARELRSMDFDGYAIGGLSVGEPKSMMYEVLASTVPELPADKVRYLMGIGTPDALLEAVKHGLDIFDCVLPTRIARNGRAMTSKGYLPIRNSIYSTDLAPLDEQCSCHVCRNYSRAYIRHLFNAGEILAIRLTTFHNLYYLQDLMKNIRAAIDEGRFGEFYREMSPRFAQYYGGVN